MPTFAVLGSGSWGTALALALGKLGHRVRIFSARAETFVKLASARESRQLPGVAIPDSVALTADPAEAVRGADCWVVAVPTAHLRVTLGRFADLVPNPAPVVVSLTKGVERETGFRPSEIITATLGVHSPVALSGPSHAEEVARGLPTSLVVASRDPANAEWVQANVGGPRLRLYTNPDIVGVELAGALKNVIGVAAGVCDGLGFGDNAKSALLTRGLVEMTRFGVAFGADPATFAGLAGLGDLIATCFSRHGRNRAVGEELARGTATLEEVLTRPQVAEGVTTARSVAEQVGLPELPITTGVYEVLYRGKSPRAAVGELLARRQRGELTFLG